MDLMQELRMQAEALQKAQGAREAQRAELLSSMETAMARSFKYFHELLKHLSIVKPANPTSYSIPTVGAFEGLTFRESFIDSRKKREGEADVYDSIHFFVRWASDEHLVIERDSTAQVQRVRDALWTCNVRYTEDQLRPNATLVRIVFTIPRNMVTDVVIRADYDKGALLFSTRNLARLGPEDFRVPAGEATKEVLDDLGRMLLGQRSNFTRYRSYQTEPPPVKA
jgi:hypothetical protein